MRCLSGLMVRWTHLDRYIPADRPVMQAQTIMAPASFDNDSTNCSTRTAVTLVISRRYIVGIQDGLLFIDETLDTEVTDIYWILPVK